MDQLRQHEEGLIVAMIIYHLFGVWESSESRRSRVPIALPQTTCRSKLENNNQNWFSNKKPAVKHQPRSSFLCLEDSHSSPISMRSLCLHAISTRHFQAEVPQYYRCSRRRSQITCGPEGRKHLAGARPFPFVHSIEIWYALHRKSRNSYFIQLCHILPSVEALADQAAST